MRRILIGCAVGIVLVAGCGADRVASSAAVGAASSPVPLGSGTPAPKQGGVPSELVGWTYQSTLVTGFTLKSGTAVQISFDANGRISAQAGCNDLGAKASVQSGRLSSGPMSMTAMGCDIGLAAQDQWLSDLLTSRPTLVVAGTKLTLASASTSISLERKKFEPPRATPTTLSMPEPIPSLPIGDFASSKTSGLGLPADVQVQMSFTADTIALRAECNTLTVHFAIDGSLITGAAIGTTEMGCDGDRMAWDKALAEFFTGSVGFKFDGANILVLWRGRDQIVLDRTTTSATSPTASDPDQATSGPTG